MKSEVVQEFNNMPFSCVFPAFKEGNSCAWDSPRLTTMYSVPDAEKGSARAVCRVVNGFVAVKFIDKSAIILGMRVRAGLFGEYAGIFGKIQDLEVNILSSSQAKILLSNGAFGFEQFQTIGNLAQNIFIRVVISYDGILDVPYNIKTSMTGALIAANAKI